jgi:beta-lactam-binding protein with PASTA domain
LFKIKALHTIKTAYFYRQDVFMTLKKFFWLIPFGCFALGYSSALFLFRSETLPTPSVVGLPLVSAVKTLSKQGIGVRISARKPSQDVAEGTVLIQSPAAGQSIKTHQTAFLVIAEQPPLPTAPSFLTLSRDAIEKEAAQNRISVTFSDIPHSAPTGTCCAQFPAPGQPLAKSSMIVYCTEKQHKLVIWPSLVGKSIGEILPWLEALNIRFEITSDSSCYSDKKQLLLAPIIDQQPRAGSIINTESDKLPIALLHIP